MLATRSLPFQQLLHRKVLEGSSPFRGRFYFTLDPNFIMLSVKKSGVKYKIWVFTWPIIWLVECSPKTQKMVLDDALIITQHYNVGIEGKVE